MQEKVVVDRLRRSSGSATTGIKESACECACAVHEYLERRDLKAGGDRVDFSVSDLRSLILTNRQ